MICENSMALLMLSYISFFRFLAKLSVVHCAKNRN